MIARRLLLGGLAAWPWAAQAQPVDKAVRIGLLASSTGPHPSGIVSYESLLAALRDLGWVDGKNLVVETRFAGPNPQRLREVAAEFKAVPVALIVSAGTTAIRAARDGAPGLPIVMINAGDPVGAGLVGQPGAAGR